MRVIAHLSDIHFGRVDPVLVQPLINAVNEMKPDVVAVSGDLTQRARSHEFKQAREFLDALPQPQIVVPGNHDVPLYNVFTRFLEPLDKYRRYITDELFPFYNDDEIAVLGVNTARSSTVKGGRINQVQIERMRERLCPLDNNMVKAIVTHHPFDLPEGHDKRDLVGRAGLAMEALASCGADLLLAGHLHVSHTTHSAQRYKIKGYSALVVQAGTAASSRGRGQANSFNIIRIAVPQITVERFEWQVAQAQFLLAAKEEFVHTDAGWKRV